MLHLSYKKKKKKKISIEYFPEYVIKWKKQVTKDCVVCIIFCVRKKGEYEVSVIFLTKRDTGKTNQKRIKLAPSAYG